MNLNVMALVDSTGFDAERLAQGVQLADYGLQPGDLTELKRLFEHATTFGSLIQVPEGLAKKVPVLKQLSEATSQDLFVSEAINRLGPLVRQAEVLAVQYDVVVANPPYIGSKFHVPVLKKYLKDNYDGYDRDVFSAFIDRDLAFSKANGRLGFMTPQVWMFISSFEYLRRRLIHQETITTLVQPEFNAFWASAHVTICSYVIRKSHIKGFCGTFIKLTDFYGADVQPVKTLEAINDPDCGWLYQTKPDDFEKIPSVPIAFWVSKKLLEVFQQNPRLELVAPTRKGMVTARNYMYVRAWHEVSSGNSGFDQFSDRTSAKGSGRKWFSYLKGGGYRKWFGNKFDVVNWLDDGRELQTANHPTENRVWATNFNLEYIFNANVNWGAVTSSDFSARLSEGGELFDAGGSACFPNGVSELFVLATLNSKVTKASLSALNPTVNFQAGNIANLPVVKKLDTMEVRARVRTIVSSHEVDWNAYERSWDFQSFLV
ncbi:MAG: Eco57I restriction-modification methylase domain-containing protein, partial [Acidobacteria bacterium]|nr:Eco57I restriction-modification methylase domain-containing protein [Acidobacteriota bacterium]